MSKTFYSRNKNLYLGWKQITRSTGYRPRDIREERRGIQFREGKFTTDDERIIKALEDIAQFRNGILEYDPDAEENKHKKEAVDEEMSIDQALLDKKKKEKKLAEIKGLFNQQ
jgi:hypothetical protein